MESKRTVFYMGCNRSPQEVDNMRNSWRQMIDEVKAKREIKAIKELLSDAYFMRDRIEYGKLKKRLDELNKKNN